MFTNANLSNYFHIALHFDVEKVKSWIDQQVTEERKRLHKGHLLTVRYLTGEIMSKA
jgi:hypothetical protein